MSTHTQHLVDWVESILEGDLSWQGDALCAQTDPDAFFPEVGDDTYLAKCVCRNCPVREECLDFALEHNETIGIWGGKSAKERYWMKRKAKEIG